MHKAAVSLVKEEKVGQDGLIVNGLFSTEFSLSQMLQALLFFCVLPVIWWLAVLFVRVPRGQRWGVVRNIIRAPVGFYYLLVPAVVPPAIAIWWGIGSCRRGGPAATPFPPFWFASYIAAALIYSWRRSRRSARPGRGG